MISKINEPSYFHRELKNDVSVSTEWWQRGLNTALPFAALYKPACFPLSVALGTARTVSNLSQLLNSKTSEELPYHLLQTTISTAALVATLFMHPVGMLITVSQDLLIEMTQLAEQIQKGDYEKCLEISASIVNNGLYLALFLHGGLELAIASLGMQMLLGIYHAHREFEQGHYLEGTGHAVMAMIRGGQLVQKISELSPKKAAAPLAVAPKLPEKTEAIITKKIYLPDEGWDSEMTYVLDNGFRLNFKWYSDPHLSQGQKVQWIGEEEGIRVFCRQKSYFLRGNPAGTYFENR